MSTEERIETLEQEVATLKLKLAADKSIELDIHQAAAYLGVAPGTLYQLRFNAKGPNPQKGPHLYKISDLDAWDHKRKGITSADLQIMKSLETKSRKRA
jgi:hypothetical protein